MFILGILTGALVVGAVMYIRNNNVLQNILKEKDILVEHYESLVKDKGKQINSLKNQIRDMYKTIDEYTSEKNTVEAEKEIQEVTLKKRKNSKK